MKSKILKRAKECVVTALFCSFLMPLAHADTEIQKAIAYSEAQISQGNTKEALDTLLEAYPYAKDGDEKTQLEFLTAVASMRAKDYATAEWVFRRILKNKPSLSRVRLELALLYFEKGNNDKAEYHFRLVQGAGDLPEIVKARISFFLYQIRYRKKWDYYINLGIAPSTNINNAGSAPLECIEYWGFELCRRVDKKRSSVGLSGSAGVDYYQRLSPNLRWKTGVNGSLADYSGGDYDTYSFGVSSGPLYNFQRGTLGIYAVGDRVWYSGKGLLYDYGAMLQASYDLSPKVSVGITEVLRKNDFDAEGYDSYDGMDNFIMPYVSYALSSRSYLIFKPSFNFSQTRYKETDKETYRLALGFGTDLPLGISLYLEPFYGSALAKGETWLVSEHALVFERRRDETYGANVRLLNRQINVLGFTPTFNYSYYRANSNASSGNYEKHVFELGITNKF